MTAGRLAALLAMMALLAMGLARVGAAQETGSGAPVTPGAVQPQDIATDGLTDPALSTEGTPSPEVMAPGMTAPGVDGGNETAVGGNASDTSAGNSEFPDAPKTKITGYERPTQKVKLVNYFFDAYGPFPLVGSALVAGINQADDSVPDWGQALRGYGRRWGSNFGIGAITTTTRYAMAEALREDTLYYRCECTGFFPRFKHALISTFTGRRGEDGHRVFSVPSLVAPYVGEMVAVYGWYPARYDAKDAFRQGNYSLLAYAGGNVALEFFPSGPHSFLSKMHLQNRHGAPENAN
jgi:hypothetical protein